MVTDDAYLSSETGSLGVATEEVGGSGRGWSWRIAAALNDFAATHMPLLRREALYQARGASLCD